jgi:anti-sigma B factor antagonist
MEFAYDEIDHDVLILSADGGLNAGNAEGFVRDIEALVDAGLRKIIVDCSRLDVISSYGLGVLVRIHRRMRQHGGDVKLCSVRGLVPQILAMTRLDRVFGLYPDANRARLAFRPPDRARRDDDDGPHGDHDG